MKKIKILAIAILLIVIAVGMYVSADALYIPGAYGDDERYPFTNVGYQTTMGIENMAQRLNNVYCVEPGQSFYGTKTFTNTGKVVIEGNVATFSSGATVTHESNNVLAAILTTANMGRGGKFGSQYTYGYKMTTSHGSASFHYTDAQLGLYRYLNTWVSDVGADRYGFNYCNSSLPGVSSSDKNHGDVAVAKAKEIASKYTCKVTIYYLSANVSSNQSLIVTFPEDPEVQKLQIPVKKIWYDNNNKYNSRPGSIIVELLANGKSTGKKLELNAQNNWQSKFEDLDIKDNSGNTIQYSIKEVTPDGYTSKISGSQSQGYNVTNTLLTEVKVVKEWNDVDDLDEYRPSSVKVTLYADGISTGKTATLEAENDWTATFEKLNKCDARGNVINYTVREDAVEKYEKPTYSTSEDEKGYVTIIVKNTHIPKYDGYIEISGKVWKDSPEGKGNDINGVFDDKDSLLEGIKVRLKYIDTDGNHKIFDSNHPESYETTTNSKGEYIIVVNYDNSENVYKLYEDVKTVQEKLKTAYVEFEYDGMKYTTVANADKGENTSKAVENESSRNKFDTAHSTVTPITTHPDKWTDKNITATTKTITTYEKGQNETRQEVIKYCNGNGTCDRTNPEAAWLTIKGQQNKYPCEQCIKKGHVMRTYGITVEKIPNINLGLFEREQPDIAIFSDLTKVEVTMNGQKYTYLYGVRGDESKDVGLQVKFQNKDTYTYRRPVNPADIAYLQEEANKNAMSVIVTYEVKVANLSPTLQLTVHNINNFFDKEYTLNTPGWEVAQADQYNTATSGNLNMTINPQNESPAIELSYTVSMEAIRNLLNEEATLNNAVEIGSYSISYGGPTLYAEQGKGKRVNQPYGGYDYDSHPGNSGIFINGDGRLEARKSEDDTDIAPSFVLCKADDPKTLSGTIWEDLDANATDDARVGNGHYEDSEKKVENVRIELYNLDGTLAKLYNKDTMALDRDAIAYTEPNGIYAIDGVVTGEYFMKFTYGDDTTALGHEATTMDGGTTKVNARNYKSTIIVESFMKNLLNKDYSEFSEEEKKWHITHEDGYSVAVDNMKQRLEIGDLYYGNYSNPLNMSAYTKPFKTQVEFESTGSSKVDSVGNITGITNVLERLDFGIAERPREDVFAQKTITYFKITLANGQLLTEGNPNNPYANIPYAKTMGFLQEINSGADARRALEKQVLVELDTELIQGAQLEVKYEVKVTNNNELDYDYGTIEDYRAEFENASKGAYDRYISKNPKAKYYYYGDASGLSEMKTTLQYVDYMNNNIVYKDSSQWRLANVDSLHTEGYKLISDSVYNALQNKKYKALESASGATVTLARGESSIPLEVEASKILANSDENVYDNNVEILKIDGKSARTIQESANGVQVRKSYTPGNYIPSLESGIAEQDDDRVKIIITPPTGLTSNVITYVLVTLVGLIVMFVGVIIIKKKVLIK